MTKRTPEGRTKRKPVHRRLDAGTWEALVRAFEADASSIASIARECGVAWHTAKKAYETGWPDLDLPPISEVLVQRRAAARAIGRAAGPATGEDPSERDRETAVLVRAALPAALYQVAEESRVLEACRRLAVNLTQTVSRMAEACDEVTEVALKRLVTDVQAGRVSSVDALRAVAAVGGMGKTVTDMVGELMKLHRLALGQPGEIIGHKVVTSPEQAVAMIDRATRAAQRARELGLVALPGGRGDGEDTDDGLEGPGEE
jgi:hypothetical protein